jgi:hypothetical protein
MTHNVSWQIWLDDHEGNRREMIDNAAGFTVSRVKNSPGVCTIVLPTSYQDYIAPDAMLEFWRKPERGAIGLFGLYFVRRWELADINGTDKVVVTGYDAIELMRRRIVAYAAGSAYAQKTGKADEILWEVVVENMGVSVTDADRSLAAYLSGTPPVYSCPEITMGFAWRNVLSVCQDICEASRQAGTELYFDWEPYISVTSGINFYFHTYTGQRGSDRSADSTTANPVFFGRDWGNLVGASLAYDYTEEVNYVYAGGAGEEANREIVEVEDATREGVSVWNRREGFCDARNASSADPTDEITSRGNASLEAGRPKITFSGTLTDTYQFKFGVDWFYGDRVTCSHFGRQFDGVIKALAITVSDSGVETIDVRIEANL